MSLAIENVLHGNHPLSDIAGKVVAGERLTGDEALRLYRSDDLVTIGALGELARRRKAGNGKEKYVYYIHNMHLNPTNICVETCRFCSYASLTARNKGYTWSLEKVLQEASSGAALGINEIHMVGGLNPAANLAYYQSIFRAIKAEFPHIHLKAMTAVEIEYLAKLEGISFRQALERLIDSGLDSMPGGGAEIFDESVREKMAVKKTPASTYLEIHGIAHGLGIKSNATMLTGIGEKAEHKVDHLLRLRRQQDVSGGFLCFIPLKCYYEGTDIKEEVIEPTGYDLLKDVAISRMVLDNFPHIKAYWIQFGEKLAQIALSFGADDMDGTIVEEKITHAAGAETPLQMAKENMEYLISQAGYTPVERDTVYNIKRIAPVAAGIQAASLDIGVEAVVAG